MVDFNEKRIAEEAKAVLTDEIRFKAEARRNKRVGLWFADTVLKLPEDQRLLFATNTMDSDFDESGYEDVIRFLKKQANKANKIFDEPTVRKKMEDEYQAALSELTSI